MGTLNRVAVFVLFFCLYYIIFFWYFYFVKYCPIFEEVEKAPDISLQKL